MQLAVEASHTLPVQQICLALAVPRSTFYYQAQPLATHPPPNALSAAERSDVLATVNSERFCNDSPRVTVHE